MSRFVVIGAGGLGGPVLYALAAAGGELVFVDDDRVALSNLQRQIQFTTADVGRPKVEVMADELVRRGVARQRITARQERLTAANAARVFAGAQVVVDGSDNLPTKFAINDAAMTAGVPFVIAGVLRYTGQVLSVVPGRSGCYRCFFEGPPADDDGADSCAQAGVLGAAVAVIAGHAAQHALALAAGDFSRAGTLYTFADLAASALPRQVRFQPRPGCTACASLSSQSVVQSVVVEAPQ
jgi:molybdopterin-synthase adenylyltransferase